MSKLKKDDNIQINLTYNKKKETINSSKIKNFQDLKNECKKLFDLSDEEINNDINFIFKENNQIIEFEDDTLFYILFIEQKLTNIELKKKEKQNEKKKKNDKENINKEKKKNKL